MLLSTKGLGLDLGFGNALGLKENWKSPGKCAVACLVDLGVDKGVVSMGVIQMKGSRFPMSSSFNGLFRKDDRTPHFHVDSFIFHISPPADLAKIRPFYLPSPPLATASRYGGSSEIRALCRLE